MAQDNKRQQQDAATDNPSLDAARKTGSMDQRHGRDSPGQEPMPGGGSGKPGLETGTGDPSGLAPSRRTGAEAKA